MTQNSVGGDDRSLFPLLDLLRREIHPALRELFARVRITRANDGCGRPYLTLHLPGLPDPEYALPLSVLTAHAFCRCYRELPQFRGTMFVFYANRVYCSTKFEPMHLSRLFFPQEAETYAAKLEGMKLAIEPEPLPEPESFNVQVRELTELSREFRRRACETFLYAMARGVPKEMKAPLKRSRLQVAVVPPSRRLDLVIDCITDDDFWTLRSRTSELAAAICKVLPQMGLLETPSFVLRCEGLMSPAFDPVSHAKQS